MSSRWWDGCNRGVVSKRPGRAVTGKVCVIERLDCGHEQPAPYSQGPHRICIECSRNKGRSEA
jgi:hypothetical protein